MTRLERQHLETRRQMDQSIKMFATVILAGLVAAILSLIF